MFRASRRRSHGSRGFARSRTARARAGDRNSSVADYVCHLEQSCDVDELIRLVAHVVVCEDDALVACAAHPRVDTADLSVERAYGR